MDPTPTTFLMLWMASGAVLAGIATIQSWWQGESTTLGDLGWMLFLTITGPVAWAVMVCLVATEMISPYLDRDTVIIQGRNTNKD